jgi:twitching motility protein PilT
MNKVERQLGQLLVDKRLLTKDDLELHIRTAEQSGSPLPRILVDEGQVRETDILEVVAERLSLRFFDLVSAKDEAPDPDLAALSRLDVEVARRLDALPIEVDASGRVVIAVPDPFNDDKRALLRKAVGTEVELALAQKREVKAAIELFYAAYQAAPEEERTANGRRTTLTVEQVESSLDEKDRPHINDLLEVLIEKGGSDLHITAGSPPQVRVNGSMVPLDQFGMMKPATIRSMIYEILTTRQREQLEETRELDCSHPLPGKGRFRVNVFFQRDSVGSVMRAIPNDIVPLAQLNMPPAVADMATLTRGMVLVTGPTGSGKSTTLASLIDLINSTRSDHIMTVEDPIEFMHKHKMSIVNQREVGADTLTFASALKHALRQDPDVILVGEMRDLETISTAITAAETGHLVFATLHTQDAPKSIERMIDVFPSHQQQQVRVQLSSSIQAVVSQQLLPTKDGRGRVAAVEVMVATAAIRNLVREGKVHQIHSAMQAGGKYGMQTMDAALAALVKADKVSYKLAHERSQDPEAFEALAGGAR